jgi:uncharacterized membrane protein
MKTSRYRPSVAALASSAVFSLSACDGRLAVLDELDRQSSNLENDDANDPSAANDPLQTDACTCASSPSLMALSCGAGEVPLLDNDVVQLTADGSVVAFNVEFPALTQQVFLWDGGTIARPFANGMLIGLSAAGDRVLFTGGAGLVLMDLDSSATAFPLDMIVGRGSLSAAGDTIIGAQYTNDVAELVRVNVDTAEFEVLGAIGSNISRAYSTPDASTTVGWAFDFLSNTDDPSPLESQRAFLHNSDGLTFGLPGAPEGLTIWPEAVNTDGTVVAGRTPATQSHFRWTEAGGFIEISSASWRSETWLSADGAVVVGSLVPGGSGDSAAFRWTEATGAVNLTPDQASLATDMSDDGNVIVATSWEDAQFDGAAPEATFIWDVEHGTRTLDQVLQDRGVDVSGWEFGHARALSGNGKVLLGRAHCGGAPTLYRIVLSD